MTTSQQKGFRWWRNLLVLAPLVLLIALALSTTGFVASSAAHEQYPGGGDSSCPNCVKVPDASYALGNQLLYVANGRASNVKVIDVGLMKIVDTIPVPPAPVNLMAPAGQLGALLDKTLGGAGKNLPLHIPDMFYWEVHGVAPSQDRKHVYAIGALSFAPAAPLVYDDIMFEVNTRTKQVDRKIPMAAKLVGYCGLEYDRNDESSGTLWAESMATGAQDLLDLFGSPLKLDLNVTGLLDGLGLGGLNNTVRQVATPLPMIGGLSKQDLASGKNTGFINTDWNGNLNSSTCGLSWTADGSRAFASQMFEPLVDTIDWNTKTVDGQILPPGNHRSTYHQSTSAKSRGLLFVTAGGNGIDIFDMNVNAMVGHIDINTLTGSPADTHGVEIAPGNDNIIYVTARQTPIAGYASELILDVSDIDAPMLIGGVGGLDTAACGVYAIDDKNEYYNAAGTCAKPKLNVTQADAFWASEADHNDSVLSVRYKLEAGAGPAAIDVQITGASGTNGATLVDPILPVSAGNVSNLQGGTVTLKYKLPSGTQHFTTFIRATAKDACGNSYNYGHANVANGPIQTYAAGIGQYNVGGYANMVRLPGKTIVDLHATGLLPNTAYAAHVHNQPCDVSNGGGHYQNVVGGPVDNANEIWPGFTTNANGVGIGHAENNFLARPEAQSVVIHAPGGARIACANLT